MDHKTLVFDISSDEEFGFDGSSTPAVDEFDWISKILEDVTDTPDDFTNTNSDRSLGDQKVTESDNNKNDDDDDVVVVVGEVIVKPKRVKRSFPMVNNDDDDCVVLECDPDKKPTVANEGKHCDDDDDDDDIVVISEKGQVACRDFPHSRHLCANFPFSSTSHECRCDLCHCYVCDSLAPCAYWGSGASSTDHCHATDKSQYWKIERGKFKQLKNPPPLPTSKPVVSSTQFPNSVQTIPHSSSPLVDPTRDVNPPFGVPNIIRQHPTLRPSVTVARNGVHPYLDSRQRSSTCNSNTQGNRASLSASGMLSHPTFKRVPNRPGYCSPNNVSVAFSNPQHLAAKNTSPNLFGSSPRLVKNPSSNLHGSSPRLVMNPSANLNGSSTRSVMNPISYQSNPRLLSSERPIHPRSTVTSHLHGCALSVDVRFKNPKSIHQGQTVSSPLQYTTSSMGQVQGISSPLQYTNSSMGQVQTISSPLVHCSTASVSNQVSQSSQQTIVAPEFLSPTLELPKNITSSSTQAPGVSLNSSSIPCTTVNDLDFSPIGPLLKDSQNEFDFEDVNSWLEGNLFEDSFPEMNSQPSQTTPIDTGMVYFDETFWPGLAHS